jgi:toxin ParE1/3/4
VAFRLSRKAEDDIRNIYVFGAQTFGVDQAERYFAGLFETFELLAQFPKAATR